MLKKSFIIVLAVFILGCATKPPRETLSYYQAMTSKPYDDVLAELKIAITEHNFRITGHSHVGKVIRERGTPGFPDYDTIQFCNLTHAKKLLTLSPHAIRHMPCNIVTYAHAGKVIVKVRLLPTDTDNPELNRFSAEMNEELRQIVDFTVAE